MRGNLSGRLDRAERAVASRPSPHDARRHAGMRAEMLAWLDRYADAKRDGDARTLAQMDAEHEAIMEHARQKWPTLAWAGGGGLT